MLWEEETGSRRTNIFFVWRLAVGGRTISFVLEFIGNFSHGISFVLEFLSRQVSFSRTHPRSCLGLEISRGRGAFSSHHKSRDGFAFSFPMGTECCVVAGAVFGSSTPRFEGHNSTELLFVEGTLGGKGHIFIC